MALVKKETGLTDSAGRLRVRKQNLTVKTKRQRQKPPVKICKIKTAIAKNSINKYRDPEGDVKGASGGGRALPEISLISGSQDHDMIVTTCRTLHSARAANRKVSVSHIDAQL